MLWMLKMNKRAKSIKISIMPGNIELWEKPGILLKQVIESNDLQVYQPCGGNATCGKCIIRFKRGASHPTYYDRLYLTPDFLDQGYRLACQCIITEDAEIEISDLSRLITNNGRRVRDDDTSQSTGIFKGSEYSDLRF